MARKPTTQTIQDEQVDVLPEVDADTDGSDAIASAEVVALDEPMESEVAHADTTEAVEKYDARAELVRMYREKRAKEENGEDKNPSGALDDDADDVADAPEQSVEAPKVAAPEQDEPTFTLLVDGKPVQMKQSEVLAKAQIAVASDNRLDEAKRLLTEARALRGSRRNEEHHLDDGDDLYAQDADEAPVNNGATNQSRPVIDAEKLTDIVQRLQVGDEEEGRQALTEYAELVTRSAGQNTPPDIDSVVRQSIAQNNVRTELETAAEGFKTSHAALVQDPELLDNSFARVRNEVRQDLAKLGLETDKLAVLDGAQLFKLHMDARVSGAPVRSYKAVFDKVGSEMSSKYGALLTSQATPSGQAQRPTLAASSNVVAERIERKRAANTQPRTAGVRQASQAQPKARSPASIVEQMRRQRGFSA